MNIKFKKVIAFVCAVVMVVSSMTITGIKVSAVDWSTADTWTKLTADGKDYFVSKDGNWLNDNYNVFTVEQGWMTQTALWINFASAEVTKVSVNGTDYSVNDHKAIGDTVRFEGAQMWICVGLCAGEQTTVEFYNNSTLKGTWYIYNGSGTGAVDKVSNVTAKGGTNTIEVSWNAADTAKEGTLYYIYLDDDTKEFAIADGTSAMLTDVPAGNHIVRVKAYYNGVFSEEANAPQTKVYGKPTAVTALAVASQKANTVQVQWDYVADTNYTIELVNVEGQVVETITEITVDGELGKCEFTNVAKGDYTVRAIASVNGENSDAVMSDSVRVENIQPAELATLEYNVDNAEQIGLSWTVNNETSGQTYKVYVDENEPIVLPANTYSYVIEQITPGSHTIRVSAVYGEYETEGIIRNVIVKAKPVVKYDTTLSQVDINGVQTLDDTWSYEFANQSSDSMIGLSADNACVVYLPSYANAMLDNVYQNITGLEVGKTYTYTYKVDTDVDGNNIVVNATADNGYSDSYEITGVSKDSTTTITKKFTATATEMKLCYTLGFINNSASVKISKAVVEMLKPNEISSLTAKSGIKTIDLSWACEGAEDEQTYNVYLNGSETPIATKIKETSYSLGNLEPGTYTVTVKAVLNGEFTTGETVENIVVTDIPTVVTSNSIGVEGFQIKTNDPDNTEVGFRTVCKTLNVGSVITGSDGKEYTVAKMGTIYTLDPNHNGYRKNDVLNPSYTILNPDTLSEAGVYTGANYYDGINRTYGFIATEEGIVSDWNIEDTNNTYYVRTMTGMVGSMALASTLHVRAFVVTEDGEIIYSAKTASISVAQIADYLYKNSKATNFTGHKYLYNNVLNKVETTNPYYRDTTLSYGWDSQLYIPQNPTFTLTEGTLDAYNNIP